MSKYLKLFFSLIAGFIAAAAFADSAGYPGTYTCAEDSTGTFTIVKFDGPKPSMFKAWGEGCGNERTIVRDNEGRYIFPRSCHFNFMFLKDGGAFYEYVPNVLMTDSAGVTRVVMNYKGSGCKIENTAPMGNAFDGAALKLGNAASQAYPAR